MNQYAKKIELPHGIFMSDKQVGGSPVYVGAAKYLGTFTHKLIAPVSGVGEVTLRCATMGEVIRTINKVGNEFAIGTRAYNEALVEELIRVQSESELPRDFFDNISYVDMQELTHYVNRGTHLTGARAGFSIYSAEGLDEKEGYTNVAWIKLHGNKERKIATNNMPVDPDDNRVMFEAYLAHLLVSFGDEPDFSKRAERHHFESITWPDFQRITAEVYARDYEPLADLLEGTVKVGESTVPFPDSPEKNNKRGKSKG